MGGERQQSRVFTEETRKTLLHGQLQEGLKYVLMKAPAVSGARDYMELCTAAKNEERRLSELNKRILICLSPQGHHEEFLVKYIHRWCCCNGTWNMTSLL